MRRSFVTPEGVDLELELASASERATAFAVDLSLIFLGLVILTIVAISLLHDSGEFAIVIWLVGFFLARNLYFVGFEAGKRGATLGKRLLGLRVVARDGARLSTAAVISRNALREIELFLPLSFLAMQAATDSFDWLIGSLGLLWSLLFLFFPLFNRDRMRAGDLIAGTWVVEVPKAQFAPDLAEERPGGHSFSEEMLAIYGVYELQTLETVLRHGNPQKIRTVATSIREKAGIADEGDDEAFLYDYYAALTARLEREMALGTKVSDKNARLAIAQPRPR